MFANDHLSYLQFAHEIRWRPVCCTDRKYPRCTITSVDVATSELRAHLSEWLSRARDGEEVVVTDRGVPVVRLMGINAAATLERLEAAGVVGRPESARRTAATGRIRPRSRRPVADVVSEQRR